jgi:phosphoglycerol transferase MdoB-like AlkP superfamily enzyme
VKLLRSVPFPIHILLFLCLALLTRVGLALYVGLDTVPLKLWPGIFLHGLFFDVLVLAWLLVPAFLWAAIVPAKWRSGRWGQASRNGLFALNAAFLLFIALSEVIFWEEFATRFNFIAVDYLIYTQEVIGNLHESYPVGWLFSGIALLVVLLGWMLRKPIAAAPLTQVSGRWRLVYLLLACSLPAAAWKASDIDQMQFSKNAFANELAGNGLMTFTAAFQRNELDYGRFYATQPTAEADRVLHELGVKRPPLAPTMSTGAPSATVKNKVADAHHLPLAHAPRHVVIVTVESLSASFLGNFGNTRHLTPRLDALAQEGLLFTRLYATGTRTVRGLEALTLGTPPIPGQAIVRRPHNDHLTTVGEISGPQGFEPAFYYGGYGYFDNMNSYYAGNAYRVVDRTDFAKESVGFENIWGIADEYLFDNVIQQLDKTHASGKRILAQVMTTSNHRPYTYPDGRIDIPSPGGRDGAVKYTDYTIGRFIDQARSKPWFKDTLFVIVADHCASAAGKNKLPVNGYHIPMVMYAPALLKPGRYTELVSQIDIPPTLLDILGLPGENNFFGVSVFAQGPEFKRRAFISNYHDLGYLTEDRLVVLSPKQKVETFSIDAQGNATSAPNDTLLRAEAIAYYQSAFQAFKSGALKYH